MKERAGWWVGICLSVAGVCGVGLGVAAAQESPLGRPPTVEGAISAITAGPEFDVDGKHVVTNAKTVYWKHVVENGVNGLSTDPSIAKGLVVGDNVQVLGEKDKHTHAIVATEILLLPATTDRVSGFAVVQKVIATSPQLMLEADGYDIVITPKTVLHNKAPLDDHTVPVANMWIAYSGRWDKEGHVVAEHAAYSQFMLSGKMKKGLEKSEGTVVAPTDGTKAGESKKDGQIVAPYIFAQKHTVSIPDDAAIQERVQRIGERLIPESQKMLAKGDPQKIDFRFYAVDHMSVPQVIGSPDGLVVIPVQVVEKLQNDDQLAAMLAEGVAQSVEWLVPPAAIGNAGPAMMALGEMPFVGPLAGIALISTGLFETTHGTYAVRLDPMQAPRVGLALMHDAGYDVRQAPVAVQTLRYGDAKTAEKAPSPLSAYLLKIIGLEYAHDAGSVANAGQSVAR